MDRYALEGRDYWATLDWHAAHCLFTWRKQSRAGFGQRSVESWNQREGHIVHCTEYIMEAVRERKDGGKIDTIIRGSERHTDEMEED